MSQQLISRSPDLKRLREEGYDIEIRSGHLLVKSVPYVNANKQVRRGTLVAPLGDMSGESVNRPSDHTAFFQGEHPCHADGNVISKIVHSTETKSLGRGVLVNHMFSAKPKLEGNYRDFHHKMVTYVGILGGPAQTIDPDASARTGIIVEPPEDESPFCYIDSSSTRAGIMSVAQKLESKKIALIGVGGTGSYVLDLVAKTPVAEIHIFDGDVFSNHNAFRSPGAASLDELKARPPKVEYLREHYSRMHRRVIPHDVYLDETNVDLLRSMDFVFLCLDRGADKRLVVERLEEWNLPFIDVGMGVDLSGDELRGSLRVTTSTPSKRDHLRKRVPFSEGGIENDYSRNIQIAELNALNAALAVIKWKKLCGFYQDLDREHCCVYTINGNQLLNEDSA
jgi:tRNA A37 threonylcarbamoyladenosine dehydratase